MTYKFRATRSHEFCAGHRVVGHEGHCRHFHGHGYVVEFTVEESMVGGLDAVGRVLDFAVIKTKLCEWLEREWDHRMILWDRDPLAEGMMRLDEASVALVPFNPTAENMAQHLLIEVGPRQLTGSGARLVEVTVHETIKCQASAAFSW